MTKQAPQPNIPALTYGLILYRKDEEHIIVLRSQDYKQCLEAWQALHDKWAEAHKEGKPFVLKEPEVTAFEPGLIKEIKIVVTPPVAVDNISSDNPYLKTMMQQGFANSFPRQGSQKSGLDILDSGYSR
jgi:hypothetical protein